MANKERYSRHQKQITRLVDSKIQLFEELVCKPANSMVLFPPFKNDFAFTSSFWGRIFFIFFLFSPLFFFFFAFFFFFKEEFLSKRQTLTDSLPSATSLPELQSMKKKVKLAYLHHQKQFKKDIEDLTKISTDLHQQVKGLDFSFFEVSKNLFSVFFLAFGLSDHILFFICS